MIYTFIILFGRKTATQRRCSWDLRVSSGIILKYIFNKHNTKHKTGWNRIRIEFNRVKGLECVYGGGAYSIFRFLVMGNFTFISVIIHFSRIPWQWSEVQVLAQECMLSKYTSSQPIAQDLLPWTLWRAVNKRITDTRIERGEPNIRAHYVMESDTPPCNAIITYTKCAVKLIKEECTEPWRGSGHDAATLLGMCNSVLNVGISISNWLDYIYLYLGNINFLL